MQNKTVFDTNIWVSYFIKGKFSELIDLIVDKDVNFFRCAELTNELYKVLSRRKFRKYLNLPIEDYMNFYVSITEYIIVEKFFEACRDKKDNYLFDLAFQSSAKYLVSGDKDVRNVEFATPFKILNLAEFKKQIA